MVKTAKDKLLKLFEGSCIILVEDMFIYILNWFSKQWSVDEGLEYGFWAFVFSYLDTSFLAINECYICTILISNMADKYIDIFIWNTGFLGPQNMGLILKFMSMHARGWAVVNSMILLFCILTPWVKDKQISGNCLNFNASTILETALARILIIFC